MRLILFLFLLFVVPGSIAQVYKPQSQHSTVSFGIKMLGSQVKGTLSGLNGTIHFDPSNLGGSKMEVTLDAKTINTGVDMRDEHLRDEDFFNTSKYPLIQFSSNRIVRANRKNTWYVYGILTMKGVQKAVEFPFTAVPEAEGYWFNAQFKINRRDFNVGESSVTMADLVVVTLNVKALKG